MVLITKVIAVSTLALESDSKRVEGWKVGRLEGWKVETYKRLTCQPVNLLALLTFQVSTLLRTNDL